MPDTEKRYQDPEWLYEQLEDEGRTQTAVAEECDVTPQAIYYWVQKFREADEWPPEDVSDPRDVVLEADLGDKLDVSPDHREWHEPLYVCATEDVVAWDVPFDYDWRTRVVSIERNRGHGPTYDLVVGPDSVSLFGAIDGLDRHHVADVQDCQVVGEVSPSKRVELLGEHHDADTPEGDDSWQRYYGPEVAADGRGE